MSSDWRPRKGCRLVATWPLGEEPPVGWQRSEPGVLIWRIATGEAADAIVEILGYTETVDCGVTHGAVTRRRNRTALGA